jgi:hypothetical protein
MVWDFTDLWFNIRFHDFIVYHKFLFKLLFIINLFKLLFNIRFYNFYCSLQILSNLWFNIRFNHFIVHHKFYLIYGLI